jgi:hypothetical protein
MSESAVPVVTGQTSDGCHTFDELYDHRQALWLALASCLPEAWKSRKHEVGGMEMFQDYFIAGATLPGAGQVTYHLPIALWSMCPGQELPHAPAYDGHTADQVVARLQTYVQLKISQGV